MLDTIYYLLGWFFLAAGIIVETAYVRSIRAHNKPFGFTGFAGLVVILIGIILVVWGSL